MIEGFERETDDLTDYELKTVLPAIERGLWTKRGKNAAVTNKEIVIGLARSLSIKTTEPRVRKIINHIRNRGLIPCLIATSSGYYIAQNRKEMEDYIASLIGREESIRLVRESMQQQLRNSGL